MTLAALCALAPPDTSAQAFPTKPVTIVAPFPAGGINDILARTLGNRLSEKWKQPVIVANKPGASGNIGAAFVSSAAADGYTLLLAAASIGIVLAVGDSSADAGDFLRQEMKKWAEVIRTAGVRVE